MLSNSNLYQKTFPSFTLNEQITLREINPLSDSHSYYLYMIHPEVSEFITSSNLPTSEYAAYGELQYWASLFKNGNSFYWAIDFNGNMIGTVGFNSLSYLHLKAEISYDLSYEHWGKGIMRRAIERIIKFAFDDLGLVRLQACCYVQNQRSILLLERLSFAKEGLMHKFEMLNSRHVDYVLYSLINNQLA